MQPEAQKYVYYICFQVLVFLHNDDDEYDDDDDDDDDDAVAAAADNNNNNNNIFVFRKCPDSNTFTETWTNYMTTYRNHFN